MGNVRPILFSGAMVKAILDGRKTQTRRVVKPQPAEVAASAGKMPGLIRFKASDLTLQTWNDACPYGAPGDRLWCRETWQYYDWSEHGQPRIRYAANNDALWRKVAEGDSDKVVNIWAELSGEDNFKIDSRARDRRWRPSIHMPRWASRITLEITEVRVQRVQETSAKDILAEGAVLRPHMDEHLGKCPISAFDEKCYSDLQSLWSNAWHKIYANQGHGWDKNPWVWAITFKRIKP